jgi:hypothetical protein
MHEVANINSRVLFVDRVLPNAFYAQGRTYYYESCCCLQILIYVAVIAKHELNQG